VGSGMEFKLGSKRIECAADFGLAVNLLQVDFACTKDK
jgi:hypothetical protein